MYRYIFHCDGIRWELSGSSPAWWGNGSGMCECVPGAALEQREWSFLLWVSGFKPPGLIHLSVGDLSQLLQSSFKSDCLKSRLWISAKEAGMWSILLILGDRSAAAVCKKATVSRNLAHHSYCICSPEFLCETLFCFEIALNLARVIFHK